MTRPLPEGTALPMVLRDMPLPDIATVHGVIRTMMEVVSEGSMQRSFASIVDEMDGRARVVWRSGDRSLLAYHDVRSFPGRSDLDALHLMMTNGDTRTTIVEARRRDRSNLIGWTSDPTTALLSSLADLRTSLAACSPDPDAWNRPKLQNDHMHEKRLADAIARSIPLHVEAVMGLSNQDVGMFVNIVMPSPYGGARYDGAETFALNPKAVAKATARASFLLPSCIMARRLRDAGQKTEEWEFCAYRTGLEMIESRADPMERLRIMAEVERRRPL